MKRLKYKKHPEDEKIWISNPFKIKKYNCVVILNWNDNTFFVMRQGSGEIIHEGKKNGKHYVAVLRKIRRVVINLGAKFEKENKPNAYFSRKNQRKRAETVSNGDSETGSTA